MATAEIRYKFDPRSGGRTAVQGDLVYAQILWDSNATNAFTINVGRVGADGEVAWQQFTRNTWNAVVNLAQQGGITLPSTVPVPGY